ncbi:MAG: GNAT family N-acetyltransferase [Sporolactobacillus sp.]
MSFVEKQPLRTFESDRLLLRPVKLSDAENMYAYAGRPENSYYVFPTNESVEQTRENIKQIFIKNPDGKYGIFLKEEDRLIGTIYLLNIDYKNRKAELSYVLNQDYEGHGYAIEAAQFIKKMLFEYMHFERLFARHTLDNYKSERLMDRLGLQKEGILRGEYLFHGSFVDLCYHGMTRGDYIKEIGKGHA